MAATASGQALMEFAGRMSSGRVSTPDVLEAAQLFGVAAFGKDEEVVLVESVSEGVA